jgi:hypothetical protein
VQPRQYVYHDIVQDDVWHTTPEMLNREYWSAFRMTFMAFEHLVMGLTPFLAPIVPHVVSSRPPLSIRKQIKLVIYRLAHGLSCKKMQDLYGCGASIIRKYTMRICRVLSSREGLFSVYIHTPTGDRLQDIIEKFRDITGVPNICGAIDGTHIPLLTRPDAHITPISADFFNCKKFHSVLLQAVCDIDKIFWNVCAGQPGGVHDVGQFRWSSLYQDLHQRRILQDPSIIVRGVQIQPFLIGDSAYLSRPYLLKNFKPGNDPVLHDQVRFDSAINSGKVVIENAFGALKNRWRILKCFNSDVDKCPTVIVACCVLHNYCELRGERLPHPTDTRLRRDALVGLHRGRQQLPDYGNVAKIAGENMRCALFASWLD